DATFSLVNRWPGMEAFHRLDLPPEVIVQLVTVEKKLDTNPHTREFEPVANWYSDELGAGELKRLWRALRDDRGRWDEYDTWAFGGLIRKQGLQNLERFLSLDADFRRVAPRLREAALESPTLDEFRARYDALLPLLVDTFHGRHTQFMWDD